MKLQFFLIRDGVTATSVQLQVQPIGTLQRILTSYMRMSGTDSLMYSLVAYGREQDISATDYLEESGTMYDVINTRDITGSHLELDLERVHG